MLIKHASILALVIGFSLNSTGYSQSKTDKRIFNDLKALADKSAAPLLQGTNALRGLVVGVVRGEASHVWGYGKAGKDGSTPDGETLFGVFSVTKPLTALLLAELSVEGKLKYDDVAMRFKDKSVTFRQLVTHTSGLPMVASGLRENSTAEFRRFLDEYSLNREPGSQFEYSTVGFGALGICLAEKYDAPSFEGCLQEKILTPLGMSSSVFELPKAEQWRFAGESVPPPQKDGPNPFNPSGGLISSANDLLRFLDANLKPQSCPKLAKAIAVTHQTCPEMRPFPGSIGGLGWFVYESRSTYFYSGIGSNFRSFIAFDLKNDCGVVMLTNPGLPPTDSRIEMAGFSLLGQLASTTPATRDGK